MAGALWYWGPLVVWLAAIFFFSTGAASAHHTSRFIEPLIRWFAPDAPYPVVYGIHVAVRKSGHVAEYGLLAMLAYRAVRGGRQPRWRTVWAVWAFAIAAVYALTDEYHQSFVGTRTGTLDDVFIDMAGAAAALVFVAWWLKRGARRPEPVGVQ
jgi:VanZ family protein